MQRNSSHERLAALELRLRDLLLEGQNGNAACYREFLATLATHLRGYLGRRLTRREAETEDLVQEVLLAVHNARHTYRPQQPVTAWVYAIARYKLADYFRAFARRDAMHQPLDEQAELFAEGEEQPAEAGRDLGRLLQQLPDRQRVPIVHVKLEGLSIEETARLTGLSSSAVKVNIHRGLKVLAGLIRGKRNDEDR